MFALEFCFPAGRLHATPWGRHVNEADVAWPPEPLRILRALIAVWRRKGDPARWSEAEFEALVEALAERPPSYALPEGAVHAHARHYMPVIEAKKTRTTLVVDAFLRLPRGAALVAVWPELSLPPALFALAKDLAEGLGHLGRAESWVEARALDAWDGRTNCVPGEGVSATEAVRAIAPLSAAAWAAERARLEADAQARAQAEGRGGRAPEGAALARAVGKLVGPTLPERLTEALALDTADVQAAGWSRPPASREVLYRRDEAARPGSLPRRPTVPAVAAGTLPTVARFLLAGRPRPPLTDALRMGELLRVAVLSRHGRDAETGRWLAPPSVSGHAPDGGPLREAGHAHAFWLPEDADDDGLIDHLCVWLPTGIDAALAGQLDGLTRLWAKPRAAAGESADGRKEWRLALDGLGTPGDFAGDSRLFGRAAAWESATPFLASGRVDGRGHGRELRRLLVRRGLADADTAAATLVEPFGVGEGVGRGRRPVHFQRARAFGAEARPDPLGALLRVTFPAPMEGPLALGYASHFGLGLFRRAE